MQLGCIELDRRGAELVFQVLTNPWLCAAIVDRLTLDDNIVEAFTISFRLPRTAKRQPRAQLRTPMWRTDYNGASHSPYL